MESLVIGGAFNNGPSVFVLISAAVYQNDVLRGRPIVRRAYRLGSLGIAIG